MSTPTSWRGKPYPLGATLTPEGVNFAIYSEHCDKVFVCLYDRDGNETAKVQLVEQTQNIWHGLIHGLKAGQYYGYRIEGPYDPKQGHRFNPNKLLLDPYSKSTSGPIDWNHACFGYEIGHPDESLSMDTRDSGPYMPKSVV
ncbi:MAG: glycogen debranching enzyme GlgX, partial [Proteobacteria bacterium]